MPVRSHSPIGSHRPLQITAVGKVMLAGMDPEKAAEIVRRRAAIDPVPPVPEKELEVRLQRVNADGYAIDIGEYDEGLTCIAAPIRGDSGQVCAALGLSGPSWRIPEGRLPSIIGLLLENARGVSRELGYTGEITAVPERGEQQTRRA